MNNELKTELLTLDFPARIIQEYLFKGYDLRSESIFENMDVYYKALNTYFKILFRELDSLKPTLNQKQLSNYYKRLNKIQSLEKKVLSILKSNLSWNKEFYITNSSGETTLIKYSTSWENISLGAVDKNKIASFLMKVNLNAFNLYTEYRFKAYIKKMAKSKTYQDYLNEKIIKNKKILAHKLLGTIQKAWVSKETVLIIADMLNIETVTANDLEELLVKETDYN